MACDFICPKYGAVAITPVDEVEDSAGDGPCPKAAIGDTWLWLPHTKSWQLNVDREDASRVRTDGTEGKRQVSCPGFIDGATAEITSVLCPTDYLWCYLFPTTTCTTTSAGDFEYLDIGNPVYLWFYFSYNRTDTDGQPTLITVDGDQTQSNIGIYGAGVAIPGDVGIDNDTNDAVEVTWTVDFLQGPFYSPAAGCASVATTMASLRS